MLQTAIHYGLHFVAPLGIAFVFFRRKWKIAYIVLFLTMLVDVDHLFAEPIYDANRCSIGFHFLHSYWATGIYIVLLFFRKTRLVGIGLVLHIITDYLDCLWMR